jgi:hypothetical protein
MNKRAGGVRAIKMIYVPRRGHRTTTTLFVLEPVSNRVFAMGKKTIFYDTQRHAPRESHTDLSPKLIA